MKPWRVLLIACVVLAPGIASAATTSELTQAASRAATWLAQTRSLDGSWGARNELKPLYTAEAVLALRAMSQRNTAYYAGLTWLENHAAPNLDYVARRVLALAPHGDDVRAGLAALGTAQRLAAGGNGGWGLTAGYQGAAFDTALALLAYAEARVTVQVPAALAYLKSSQLSDGGWRVAEEPASDPVTTAVVLHALVPHRSSDPGLATPIATAAAFLAASVTDAAPAYLQGLAALALLRENLASAAATARLDRLWSTQAADGSWGQDFYATALAVRAIAAKIGRDIPDLALPVHVPDLPLRRSINAALGRNLEDRITRGDLMLVTSLNARGQRIRDLTGLERAVNLTWLDLSNNGLTSLSALAGLTKLSYLDVSGNNLTSVYQLSDVSRLPALKTLIADGNPFTDRDTTADPDGDGATDADEIFAGTDRLLASSRPAFGTVPDPLGLPALEPWHVTLGDLDGDGDADALAFRDGRVVNPVSCGATCTPAQQQPGRGALKLYERVDNGFTEVVAPEPPYGNARDLLVFDYDNDGQRDVLLVIFTPALNGAIPGLVLLKNVSRESGALAFVDVTPVVGIPAETGPDNWGAAILDVDRDGYPEIFALSTGLRLQSKLLRWDRSTGLYQNRIASSGLPLAGHSLSAGVDLDDDGLTDLVLGVGSALHVYRNNGDGTFADRSPAQLATLFAAYAFSPAIRALDYDRDGRQDLVVAINDPMLELSRDIRVLRNGGAFAFTDTIVHTDGSQTDSGAAHGVTVFDFDNDGWRDFATMASWSPKTTIHRNQSPGAFAVLGRSSGLQEVAWTAPAAADFNGDGRVDVVVPATRATVWRRNLGTSGRSVTVRVVGRVRAAAPSSGRDALGGRVEVTAGGVTTAQQVQAVTGAGLELHFGVGAATVVDRVQVIWPSGSPPTALTNVAPGQIVTITEP